MIREVFCKIKRSIYTSRVKKNVAKFGKNVKVNNKSKVTKNTFLGNNVNFNGMEILGKGRVIIGDNFHSEKNVWLLLTYIIMIKGKKYLMILHIYPRM